GVTGDSWVHMNPAGAELAGPELVAGGVVLAHEGIKKALVAGLARQDTESVPGHVDPRGIHGHAGGKIRGAGAELAGPELGAGGGAPALREASSPPPGPRAAGPTAAA